MGDTPFPSLTMEKEPCDNRRERHRRKIDLLFLKLQKVLLQAPETRRRKVLEKACTALLSMKASESLRGTCNKGTWECCCTSLLKYETVIASAELAEHRTSIAEPPVWAMKALKCLIDCLLRAKLMMLSSNPTSLFPNEQVLNPLMHT